MMTSLAQAHSPYPVSMQHPGMPPHMCGGQQHPQQGQPNPGMQQQMHMGVNAQGQPQVMQAGAMMGGMPQGVAGPNAHALQHLNPAQQQQFLQQQQQQMAMNPAAMQQQQQFLARQQAAARQAFMTQQSSGPMAGMPNGMTMDQARMVALRQAQMGRPVTAVNLGPHLQQAQQDINQQQMASQQQHMLQQQQLAMQHQQAQAGAAGPHVQMNAQQIHNLQQAQIAAQQHQQQQQAQAAQAAAQHQAHAQAHAQAQGQGQANPAQPQGNGAMQVMHGQQGQVAPSMQQQAAAAVMLQQRRAMETKGICLMRLYTLADNLSVFSQITKPLSAYLANESDFITAQRSKQRDDMSYWTQLVDKFFTPGRGVFRHSVWIVNETANKQYEIPSSTLARYFFTHFESGVKSMQLMLERAIEKDLPNHGHCVESAKSSFIYWFDNGSQLIASGSLRVHFDAEARIELLDFVTSSHEEFVPRNRVLNAARPLHEWQKEWHRVNSLPDSKAQSPELNKKRAKIMKSPLQPPPEIDLPDSMVKSSMGITQSVFRFLELAEVIGQMKPLFDYASAHSTLAPYAALDQYVAAVQGGGAQNSMGPRTSSMHGQAAFGLGASPAAAHLNLTDGSPHTMGGALPQAPSMQLQQSQHGTSSSGPSANTSPNAGTKRRRPSGIKDEDINVNGIAGMPGPAPNKVGPGVKASPRTAKRAKGNPA